VQHNHRRTQGQEAQNVGHSQSNEQAHDEKRCRLEGYFNDLKPTASHHGREGLGRVIHQEPVIPFQPTYALDRFHPLLLQHGRNESA